MHPSQRFREPAYLSQFKPFLQEAKVCLQDYEGVLTWFTQYAELKKLWVARLEELNKRCSEGLSTHSREFNELDKDLERMDLVKSQRQLGQERLLYRISIIADHLLGFYGDIRNDFEYGFIDKSEYQKYLSDYRDLFNNSFDLPSFKKTPADIIAQDIKQFQK